MNCYKDVCVFVCVCTHTSTLGVFDVADSEGRRWVNEDERWGRTMFLGRGWHEENVVMENCRAASL